MLMEVTYAKDKTVVRVIRAFRQNFTTLSAAFNVNVFQMLQYLAQRIIVDQWT